MSKIIEGVEDALLGKIAGETVIDETHLVRIDYNKRQIIITVPFDTLPIACQVAFDEAFEQHDLRVTNADAFAKELYTELCREDEDGTTLVHEMLDRAVINAVENGADGVEWDVF